MHRRVGLDRHELVDLDGAAATDAAEVVALEVDQHDVLGAFLLVQREFALECRIGRVVAARGTRAGDRAGARDAVAQLQQALGR